MVLETQLEKRRLVVQVQARFLTAIAFSSAAISYCESHILIASITCSFSSLDSSRPLAISCHFSRQLLQQVAVACCAINTGCPFQGVCFPSLTGYAAANRLFTKSAACSRIIFMPFRFRYSNSFWCKRTSRRKEDVPSAAKTSCKLLIMEF